MLDGSIYEWLLEYYTRIINEISTWKVVWYDLNHDELTKLRNILELEIKMNGRTIPFNLANEKKINPFLNQNSILAKKLKVEQALEALYGSVNLSTACYPSTLFSALRSFLVLTQLSVLRVVDLRTL